MTEKTKALFLDIDGVLCTNRTMSMEKYGTWQFDPVGIGLLKRLFRDFPGWKIVMSSTWRYGNNVFHLLMSHGISNIHTDSQTPYWPMQQSIRGREIWGWLEEHPDVTEFLILDDEIFDIESHFEPDRIIHTDRENGITFKNYLKMREQMERIQREENA